MQKNKTLVNKAMKAMLVAGFAAAMFPASVYAVDVQANTYAVAAQQNQIKGTVVDEFGEPMIGVTIKVKGAQVAGITDEARLSDDGGSGCNRFRYCKET